MYGVPGNQEEWTDPSNDPRAVFAARITEAAYEVALRHGVQGSFAELELDLWRRIRFVVATTDPATGWNSPIGDAA